jgi:3-oxoacyl-[acyl-carrier-protein] synthase-1
MVGVFGAAMPIASSTKPMLGHALGAAGALEAAVSALALSEFNTEGALPPHVWDGEADPALPVMRWARGNEGARPRVVMSNSFGFGGTNVSLILGRAS